MANLTVSRRFPTVPSKAAIKFGLPVSAGSLVPLVDGFTSMVGWRCLRAASWTADHTRPLAGTYIESLPNADGTIKMWFTSSDIAAFGAPAQVGVAIVYQAANVASAVPSIQVDLLEQSGAGFRDAIKWDAANGVDTLPTQRSSSADDRQYPLLFVASPFVVDGSAVDTANPTTPRLLNYADANDRRTVMEVRVKYVKARPLFVYVFEAYREVLAQ
jgi:hypothetical protein